MLIAVKRHGAALEHASQEGGGQNETDLFHLVAYENCIGGAPI